MHYAHMLDAALAGSSAPAESSHPPAEPPPGRGVGHCCTHASHDSLKDLVRSWLEYKSHWPDELSRWLDAMTADDQRDLGGWLATQRPWPGTDLVLGECHRCHSSLSVCSACRDDGEVEEVTGRIVSCDCVRGDVSDAWLDVRREVA